MRNLKVKTLRGHVYTVKLPKDGFGKRTPAWYMRETTTAADIKTHLVKRGQKLIGTRQR
jgi:hypothetical protein